MSILAAFPLTARRYNASENYSPGASFFEYNGKEIYFNLNSEEDYRKAYLQSPSVKAIVNRRAQMFVNGKISVLNANNEKPLRGEYAKALQVLIDQPNFFQSQASFIAQQNIYIDIFGYCPVIKITPIGFPKEIKSLWNLPPWLFDYDLQDGVPFTQITDRKQIFKNFWLKWGGEKKPLDMDSVFIVMDNSIGTDDDGNVIIPDSRLKGHDLSINNDIAARKANNTLIVRKGPAGILSNDPGSGQYVSPRVGAEKELIQRDFKRYGITGQEFQVIITDANLKWQSMGSPMRELMLFETMNAAQADLCDGLGMYAYLMNNRLAEGTTFTNLNEAKKSQYQDFIIPDATSRIAQLSAGIIPAEELGYYSVDFSHVEVLQESEQARAVTEAAKNTVWEGRYRMGLMTRNMILKELGLPTVDLPEMNLYSWQQVQVAGTDDRFPTQANPG